MPNANFHFIELKLSYSTFMKYHQVFTNRNVSQKLFHGEIFCKGWNGTEEGENPVKWFHCERGLWQSKNERFSRGIRWNLEVYLQREGYASQIEHWEMPQIWSCTTQTNLWTLPKKQKLRKCCNHALVVESNYFQSTVL